MQLSIGRYAFKVAVSGENAFGEGFVNVTVKPGKLGWKRTCGIGLPRLLVPELHGNILFSFALDTIVETMQR